MNDSRVKVTVYSRPGCHLCDEALDQIKVIAREGAVSGIEVIDIEGDDDLIRRYLERIPVVMVDGEVVSELVFDPATLRTRLGSA
ncbi:MAG: glutaredoxin family protein [Solirubrobacterales bacterium]